MALSGYLDAAVDQHFADMTLTSLRDVLKEVQANGTEAAIAKELERLSPAQMDTLMKAVYIGLAKDSKNSSIYFRWHNALFKTAGSGSIVRVIADKPPKVAAE
jgi:hypothetical protein